MKKTLLSIFLILLFICGCNAKTTIRQVVADRNIRAHNFEELISVSDVIIKAKVLPDKENVTTYVYETENTRVVDGYTKTKLQVIETYKDNTGIDKIVVITEEYYQDGLDIWTQGNYLPARENQEYIFFLIKYDPKSYFTGMYYPVDLERGKYSLNSKIINQIDSIDTLTNAELEIWENPDNGYRAWYKKVIEQYCPKHK